MGPCVGWKPVSTLSVACPVLHLRSRPLSIRERQTRCASLREPNGNKKGNTEASLGVGIFGAGAAGLSAAYFAATNAVSTDITLYEKTSAAGAKIKASGGSRCNIMPNSDWPLNIDTDFHVPASSKKGPLRALLASWNPHECRSWLEYDIGIPLKLEEASEKLFPISDNGAEVRDLLAAACVRAGVRMETNAQLVAVEPVDCIDGVIVNESGERIAPNSEKNNTVLFRCRLADGRVVTHSRIVLATGGKSFAGLGTTGDGYEILQKLGIGINTPEPALTPLLFSRKDNALVSLAGVSLQNAILSVSFTPNDEDMTSKTKKNKKRRATVKTAVRGQSLITHRGMSGPDAMDLSQYSNLNESYLDDHLTNSSDPRVAYRICWNRDVRTPEDCESLFTNALTASPKKTLRSILSSFLPLSLATFLLDAARIDQQTNISSLKKSDRVRLIQLVTAYELDIGKNEGFPKAEVTSGGVPLENLDIATMQVRNIPGLHVIGELVDVHGRIGGFNFLLAWYEGRLAGRASVANLAH